MLSVIVHYEKPDISGGLVEKFFEFGNVEELREFLLLVCKHPAKLGAPVEYIAFFSAVAVCQFYPKEKRLIISTPDFVLFDDTYRLDRFAENLDCIAPDGAELFGVCSDDFIKGIKTGTYCADIVPDVPEPAEPVPDADGAFSYLSLTPEEYCKVDPLDIPYKVLARMPDDYFAFWGEEPGMFYDETKDDIIQFVVMSQNKGSGDDETN